MQIPKQQWIDEAYKLLVQTQGAPENQAEERNLREWAELFASDDVGHYSEGLTPQEAVGEELSASS